MKQSTVQEVCFRALKRKEHCFVYAAAYGWKKSYKRSSTLLQDHYEVTPDGILLWSQDVKTGVWSSEKRS